MKMKKAEEAENPKVNIHQIKKENTPLTHTTKTTLHKAIPSARTRAPHLVAANPATTEVWSLSQKALNIPNSNQ